MNKKARLKKELKSTAKAIKFLMLVSPVFLFLVLYSYGNLSYIEKNQYYSHLASQKGFNVFVTIRESRIPVFLTLINETYVCEGNSSDFPVKVLDLSRNVPNATISLDNPGDINPFYIVFYGKIDEITNEYRIVSFPFTKSDAGGIYNGSKKYPETIYMSSGSLVASKNLNITVIEINNAPVIENIGVKTIATNGNNSVFNYKVNVTDIEDGNGDSGNLIFDIGFEGVKLFNISSNGTMHFKPNSRQNGTYNISVCVKDRGIINPHPNISLCLQDGSSITVCNNFSLTITYTNQAPNITHSFPLNKSLGIMGNEVIEFNITAIDPDENLLDVYWYVDNVLRKYESQKEYSNFSYNYICGDPSKLNISVVVTDGELNDSILWNVTVLSATCPATIPGGGGGGGGGVSCNEKWVCGEWSECMNLKESYSQERVSYKVNTLITPRCSLFNWDEKVCGYQIRECKDLKKCKSNLTLPGIMQECYYVLNPGCNDGIKNCHNNSCEIGVDCGGVCSACPTCNDGIKNQNEEDIDCGGVCPKCIKETPKSQSYFFNVLMYLSLLFLILAFIGITFLGVRYILLQKKLEEVSSKGSQEYIGPGYRNKTSFKRDLQ